MHIELPPISTTRWTPNRKEAVVLAIRKGQLGFNHACNRYDISAEELRLWNSAMKEHGTRALRVTKLKMYRKKGNENAIQYKAAGANPRR